jgi:hypothetical protein
MAAFLDSLNNDTFRVLVLYLVTALVPIIPAIVTFKLLPSTAMAKGPLQGLQLNFTGGVAAYLLFALIAVAFVQVNLPRGQAGDWREVSFSGQAQLPGAGDFDQRRMEVRLQPTRTSGDGLFADNIFSWTMVYPVRVVDGKPVLPFDGIVLEYAGYAPAYIRMDDASLGQANRIDVGSVTLRAIPTDLPTPPGFPIITPVIPPNP